MTQATAFLKRYWLAIAITVIAIVCVIGYVAGYRISTGFTFVRVGTLQIIDLPADAQVFVDYGRRGDSSTGTMAIPLVPGNHTVIVSETNMNPWETIATVTTRQDTTIDPILVPVRPTISLLSATDTVAAKAAIAAVTLPSAAAPLTLGCSSVSLDGNRIVADVASSTSGCATPPSYLCSAGSCGPTIVFSPAATIRQVIAYPGRTDALLVVAGNDLYAIGLDPRAPQTFADLISAPNIMVASLSATETVVQNANGYYALTL